LDSVRRFFSLTKLSPAAAATAAAAATLLSAFIQHDSLAGAHSTPLVMRNSV